MTKEQAKDRVIITKKEVYPYSIDDNVDELIDEIYNDFKLAIDYEIIECDNKQCFDTLLRLKAKL